MICQVSLIITHIHWCDINCSHVCLWPFFLDVKKPECFHTSDSQLLEHPLFGKCLFLPWYLQLCPPSSLFEICGTDCKDDERAWEHCSSRFPELCFTASNTTKHLDSLVRYLHVHCWDVNSVSTFRDFHLMYSHYSRSGWVTGLHILHILKFLLQ